MYKCFRLAVMVYLVADMVMLYDRYGIGPENASTTEVQLLSIRKCVYQYRMADKFSNSAAELSQVSRSFNAAIYFKDTPELLLLLKYLQSTVQHTSTTATLPGLDFLMTFYNYYYYY